MEEKGIPTFIESTLPPVQNIKIKQKVTVPEGKAHSFRLSFL